MARRYSPLTRAFIAGLRTGGMSVKNISERMGIPIRTVREIYTRVCARGFDPAGVPLEIKTKHVEALGFKSGDLSSKQSGDDDTDTKDEDAEFEYDDEVAA